MNKEYLHVLRLDKKTGKIVKQPVQFDSTNHKVERNIKNHYEESVRRNQRMNDK